MLKFNYKLVPNKYDKNIKYDFKEEKNQPVISIITPFYNSGKYIEETVNSILNQTYPNFEWIIVDDGSTDKKSLEILGNIKKMDKRIKVFHKENEGLARTRDFGTEQASKYSKYYFFLDDDDLINKTYLECAYWTLETNKKASWAYCDVANFAGQEILWRKWFDTKDQKENNLLVATALIRKEVYNSVGGYGIKEKAINEDWIFWLKLLAKGKYPVRMNFYGFWYRKKSIHESELEKSKKNIHITMEHIEKYRKEVNDNIEAIQYPVGDFNWEQIVEKNNEIKVMKRQKNDKVNILMIIPWMEVGGADKFNLDIIKRINKNKFEITIITTLPAEHMWRQKFEEHCTIYDLTSFLDIKYWPSFINYLIEKNNINLIFNTNSLYGYNILPYLKIKHPEIPIMDYVHMEEWYNRNGGFSRDSSAVSSVIDKTYVCNKNSENILINHFKRESEDVGTIYIGGDEIEFDPDKYNKEDIFDKLKIKEKYRDKHIISYICRIANQKRPYLLLEIIYYLKKERNDFVVVVAGDGPMLKEIKNKAKHMKIDKNIVFLGNVNCTQNIYAISDITLNCSIKEGLALTSYESLLMGVPVISSDVGGQRELINKDVGVIVPCRQEEEDINVLEYKDEEINDFVIGINTILNNLEKYKSKCRKRVLNGFTIDNMVVNMEKVFTEVSSNPNRQKIEDAKKLKSNIDISKELINKFWAFYNGEYNWLCERINSDIKNVHGNVLYERTFEYKIKHPFYVILTKLGLYEKLKRNFKWKGKTERKDIN